MNGRGSSSNEYPSDTHTHITRDQFRLYGPVGRPYRLPYGRQYGVHVHMVVSIRTILIYMVVCIGYHTDATYAPYRLQYGQKNNIDNNTDVSSIWFPRRSIWPSFSDVRIDTRMVSGSRYCNPYGIMHVRMAHEMSGWSTFSSFFMPYGLYLGGNSKHYEHYRNGCTAY